MRNGSRSRLLRGGALIAALAIACFFLVRSAAAQSISIIRDTEIERVLHSYEDPLLRAAGLDPATTRLYLVNDPSINAFAAQSPAASETEDIFVFAGLLMQLKTPNQVIGVLAHETGHIAGGHTLRSEAAMRKAMIPMLIGMAVGIAAMAAGAGDAGIGAVMMGQQAAQSQFFQFSRAQEATADQMGNRYLLATHQSARGMLEVFGQFAREEAQFRALYPNTPLLSDHPGGRERIDALQQLVESSPYKDVKDSPETVQQFRLVQAKLAGYLSKPETVLARYPLSDTSQEARYARAMAYFRKPDMQKALAEANSLVKDKPGNPYFWELLGQIYVEMSRPDKGIPPYQKAVDLLPDAPLLRISLAAAQLATEQPGLAKPALDNLKIALRQENDNTFAWYQTAQAYSNMGNEPMANLSTAELDYHAGNYRGAAHFAMLAQHRLTAGSPDWQRATDILAVADTGADRRGR